VIRRAGLGVPVGALVTTTVLGCVLAAMSVVAGARPATAASTSDAQLGRAGVFVASDFPADWTQTKRANASDDALDGAAAKIPSCKPFVAFSKANRKYRRAQSPNFNLGSSTVTNAVSVYPSAEKATAVITTFTDSRMPACLEQLFDTSYQAQLKRDPKTAKKVTSVKTSISTVPGVRFGDQSIAYQGTVDIGLTDGTTQTVGLGFAATRVGKALAGYSWTSEADISAALQPAIVKSAGRLQTAQSTG
jgi:hypothetical protein